MRRDYDAYWEDMRAGFDQIIAIPVGDSQEEATLLSARDWHPTAGRVPWKQGWIDDRAFDSNGFWWIDARRAGRYEIELRTGPREADRAMGVVRAWLRVGDARWSKTVAEDESRVVFEVELATGISKLRSTIADARQERVRGAYYVYVSKL